MIIPLRTSYLQHGELAETTSAYLQKVNAAIPSDPFLQRITETLEEDLAVLNDALTAVRINALTQAVSEADALRDDLFIAFKEMLSAMSRRPEAIYSDGYQALWPILERAGLRLYILGYSEQSGRLEAMLEEMSLEGYQTHLTNMGLLDLFNSLKQSQANFTELYEQRLDLDSQQNYPTLKDAKQRIVPRINILLDTVGFLYDTEPEDYESLVNDLNAITSQIMTVVRARRSRDAKALAGEPVIDEQAFDG